ncbi:hypothetical protein [Levilactobacillus lindianensis]|uniref:hypothetical protein n=1 Tax=Levilactobacillus lindianensis TaxID=2486018 RepID=UPI0013DE1424|nr:hypothetical protein [Levilactobacillus lindianensis]
MQHDESRRSLPIWVAILGVVITLSLGLSVIKADAAKTPSHQKLRTEKAYYIGKFYN